MATDSIAAAQKAIADSLATLVHPAAGDKAWPAPAVRDTTEHWVRVEDGADSISTAVADSVAASVNIDPVGSLDGVRPEALTHMPGHSSIITAILLALFVGAGCNPSAFRKTLAHYRSELWNVRKRRNAFDEDTAGGLGVMRMFLASAAVIVCGVCAALCAGALSTFSIIVGVAAVAAFYIFEYCAYWTVGYAFALPDARKRWLGGFSASMALTGVFLFVPAMLLLYFPEWTAWLSVVCLVVFVAFRLVFIYKGFRIFFDGIASLLYFILYLCTLEIIPLVALLKFLPVLMAMDI